MQTLELAAGSRMVIGAGCLAAPAELLDEVGVPRPRAVVTDTVVGPLVGRRFADAVGAPPPLELKPGEENKRWQQAETACRAWLGSGLGRGDVVAAVGGGVLTDTAGFAAAVFMRGVAWIAAPTTLLGMVDAAVGGKTGVNLDEGKNLVGAFWAPRLVAADPLVLGTLDRRQLRAGLAEVVKTGWIGDHGLLGLAAATADGFDPARVGRLEELVARAAAVKARVVASDEREAGARKALNLGHTLGHAFEAATGYRRFLHGEAVAWGMRAVAELARRRGVLSDGGAADLRAAIAPLAPLPPVSDLDPDAVIACAARDKKRDDLGIAWVLPSDDGVLLDQRVPTAEVRAVLRDLSG